MSLYFLVSTNKVDVVSLHNDKTVIMVDGDIPGWITRSTDLLFDHHRVGGAAIQIDDIDVDVLKELHWSGNFLFVTPMLDADAIMAAAYVIGIKENILLDSDIQRMRAIAYDCDHLFVPSELSEYRQLAVKAVMSFKVFAEEIAEKMGLSPKRMEWTAEQKLRCDSFCFKASVLWVLDAIVTNNIDKYDLSNYY